MRRLARGVLALALAAGIAGWAASVEAADPPLSREAVEQIVRDYLIRHPEVVGNALRALEQQREVAERQRRAEALRTYQKDLTRDPAAPVAGNPDGDVTVVEFFDYRCGFCKTVLPTVQQLLREDPKVRVVYKELPILGPDSLLASRAALAARTQGKYAALHDALMAAREPLTRPTILDIARRAGLDAGRLDKDMEAPAILAQIRRNHELAEKIGINGTPAFVIGAELAPGALDLATLKRLVDQARRK
jgi:protein-disulfide isomerase